MRILLWGFMSANLLSGEAGGPVLSVPSPGAIRDELAKLVVRDLLGPVGGEWEEGPDSPTDW